MRYFTLIFLIFLLILPISLIAQDNVLDIRAEVDDESNDTYYNFIFARNFGRIMVEAFHIRLPQAGNYRETYQRTELPGL